MKHVVRIIGIASIGCLMAGPASAQTATSPAPSPSNNPSQGGSQTDRPVPLDPSSFSRPDGMNRGRSNQDTQAPRDNQSVQSPRDNPDMQSPRGKRMGGSMGNVRSAQEALKAQGFDPGDIDGRYGPNTRAAVANYQRTNGLRETGQFDQATLAQLGVESNGSDGGSNQVGPNGNDGLKRGTRTGR